MITTQKVYLGEHPIQDVRFGQHKVISKAEGLLERYIGDSCVLFLDSVDGLSYEGYGANTWYDLSQNNNVDIGRVKEFWSNSTKYWTLNDTITSDEYGIAPATNSFDIFDGDFTIQFVGAIDATSGAAGKDLCAAFTFGSSSANPGVIFYVVRNNLDANYKKVDLVLNGTSVGISTGDVFDTLGDFFMLHIVRSGSTITYYKDGSSIGTGSSSANANNNNDLHLMLPNAETNTNFIWNGKYAHLGFYDKALSSDERQQNLDYFKNKLNF